MRKNIFTVIIALIMIFTLSACGAEINKAPASSPSSQENNEQASANSVSTAPATDDTTANVEPSSNNDTIKGTASQKNAIREAQNYLNSSAFSRQGLISQLEYEGYSTDDATYAVDQCGVDWKEQAARCAKNYLKSSAFSRQGLIDQLEYEGFTNDQATYGADASGLGGSSSGNGSSGNNTAGISVSKQNAARAAQDYLESSAFSEKGLLEQLEYEGYSTEDAQYGVDQSGADWKEQAAKCAESYLESSAFSRSELIDQLEYEGFTHEQAVYGADSAGL